jgi:hypothetical protein
MKKEKFMRSNHQIEEISSRLGMRASVLVGLSFGALIYALLPQTLKKSKETRKATIHRSASH